MPKNPKTTFSIIPPTSLAGVTDQKVLIVGQQLAGTAVDGALTQRVGNDGEEDGLYGAKSHLAKMIREFKKINKLTQVDAIGLADAGGAADATAVFTIGGPATADGTVIFKAVSGAQHSYTIAVASGDSATDIGDALEAAITADADAPFTAANVTGTVTLTASNGGTLGNLYTIGIDDGVLPTGVTVALTAWASGATDPTLTTLFDPVANIRYQTVVYPSAWAIATAQTFIDARFNVSNGVKDGVVVLHAHESISNLKTLVSTLNSESISYRGTQLVSKATLEGDSVFEADDVLAARFGAARALRLTEEAPLSSIQTVSGAPRDAFGGVHISTLPYFNSLVLNTELPDVVDVFDGDEESELEGAGVGTLGLNSAGNAAILGQQVTTYLTTPGGSPDETFKFLNQVDASVIIREYFLLNNQKRFEQSRLVDGDLEEGYSMANETSIRAFQKKLYVALSKLAITQSGTAAVLDFEENLSVVVDVPAGTVTIDSAPLQVGQLRVILGTITVNLGG